MTVAIFYSTESLIRNDSRADDKKTAGANTGDLTF